MLAARHDDDDDDDVLLVAVWEGVLKIESELSHRTKALSRGSQTGIRILLSVNKINYSLNEACENIRILK